MILELDINNNKEIFVNTHVTGMIYRDALYFRHRQVTEDFTPLLLDQMVDFVCRVFGNKFTVRQFYNGIDKQEIFSTINLILDAVITQDCNRTAKIEQEKISKTSPEKNIEKTIEELQEIFDKHCIHLIKQGYKINEIDLMDINYYFYLLSKTNGQSEKEELVYIDDIL